MRVYSFMNRVVWIEFSNPVKVKIKHDNDYFKFISKNRHDLHEKSVIKIIVLKKLIVRLLFFFKIISFNKELII